MSYALQCGAQGLVVKPAWRSVGGLQVCSPLASRSNCPNVGFTVCSASSADEGSPAASEDSSSSSSLANLLLETRGDDISGRSELGHKMVVDLDEEAGSSAFSVRSDTQAYPATLSAPAYTPPPGVLGRPILKPAWITGGALLSLVAATAWYIHVSETNARKKLVFEREDNVITPPPPPEMLERYERARASVEQTGMINRAVGALQRNDFIKCIVEVELALEQNRTARRSVTSDFYEEGQLQRLYRTALKTWLDGYPLDYGKLLQLREMLAIPTADAEAIEADVQRQSDVYVI